ncbi:hypothetical protein PR202_gb01497 [Eleusine coracana subsp. coracana]|uniref:Rab-GAP TBC domain-containing protein n=1 Tax=Eleusine coracana subsp. coracana TaxID=191504 RepID=A0AAV5DWT3_ELECO|nr:hypothetical protein PR202_gb01497 [Eleusine coracana subsp. coracana]
MKPKSLPFIAFEHKRCVPFPPLSPPPLAQARGAYLRRVDSFGRSFGFLTSCLLLVDGFRLPGISVRPQHLQRYKEYAGIYKEEEEERSDRWKNFLARQTESSEQDVDQNAGDVSSEKTTPGPRKIEIWTPIRSSLGNIEQMMSLRVDKKQQSAGKQHSKDGSHSVKVEQGKLSEDSDDEFYDVDKVDPAQEVHSGDATDADVESRSQEEDYISKEELECLVHGGLPMALRGELWQAFVGTGTRRINGYYDSLAAEAEVENNKCLDSSTSEGVHEKWIGQIEKDLPRTFPGHPALDEDGRNALRRLLIAYARHNPSVGYCQAMNFFAGLLLLLMPEENAFWTLVGIIDDYFDGYFSEEMIESQVDQLVLEELVREKFPKLANHLDYLGLQVAWVTGPWFLSIFTNVLPWESVLRVWDVLLFDGNRVMLFRTALALLEFYGPALVTTKDAGDAVTLLHSLAGSTFDSSQLVLTARMGYQSVNEAVLQELRNNHRPSVISSMEERAKGLSVWTDTDGLASKLYNFKREPEPLVSISDSADQLSDVADGDGNQESDLGNMDDMYGGVTVNSEIESLPDPKDQVAWLKLELCRLIEERRSAVLRADELETALMEMVKQDNRRQLSAKVEQLEQDISELRQSLSDKDEQEQAMFQVLMRVEQELKIAEEARISAEQDAAAQRYAANVLQEKYEEAMASFTQMENRAVMAETMLEATLQYQSSQQKALSPCPSPRTPMLDASNNSSQEFQPRKKNLLGSFSLSWRDKNKEKQNNADDSTNTTLSNSNNDEMVETSNKDDDRKVETLKSDNEHRAESPKDSKLRVETPEKDAELPKVQIAASDMNGQHEQMQEIHLD